MIHSYIPFYTLICFLAVYLVFSSPISGFWRVLPNDLITHSLTGMNSKISKMWWILRTIVFLKFQSIYDKFNQNHFWCSHLWNIRYNSLFNICWYWWNPSLFVVLLYRFSKSISLNKMPAVIFYLNVHGNHILPQYQFLFSLQINFHFIVPVELLLDNGICIWTFLEKGYVVTYYVSFT